MSNQPTNHSAMLCFTALAHRSFYYQKMERKTKKKSLCKTQQKPLQESKAALKSQFLDLKQSQIATKLFKFLNIFYLTRIVIVKVQFNLWIKMINMNTSPTSYGSCGRIPGNSDDRRRSYRTAEKPPQPDLSRNQDLLQK